MRRKRVAKKAGADGAGLNVERSTSNVQLPTGDSARGVGRPTKLTPEIWTAIWDGVEGGMSPSRAAILLNISPKTLSDWRGENPEFADMIERARAWGIRRRIKEIDGAIHRDGRKDWKAQAWLLGKMAPEEFGDKVEHEVRGSVTLEVPVEHLKRLQARRREQLAKLAERTKDSTAKDAKGAKG